MASRLHHVKQEIHTRQIPRHFPINSRNNHQVTGCENIEENGLDCLGTIDFESVLVGIRTEFDHPSQDDRAGEYCRAE